MSSSTFFARFLWPDEVAASAADKTSALTLIDAGVTDGLLPEGDVPARSQAVQGARTRGDLYVALDGLVGGVPPWGLTVALRIASAAWIAMTVVQLVVWASISLANGAFDTPWWAYSTAGGAVIVLALWLANESYLRGARPRRSSRQSQR